MVPQDNNQSYVKETTIAECLNNVSKSRIVKFYDYSNNTVLIIKDSSSSYDSRRGALVEL